MVLIQDYIKIEETEKPWLVQKYGGTSLGKLLETICGSIVPSYLADYNVIVVCSALSGSTKSTGTTSLLLECISHALSGYSSQVKLNKTIDIIRDNHINLLEKCLVKPNGTHADIYSTTKNEIVKECECLRSYLLAAQVCECLMLPRYATN
jgi:aspartate kinase